MRSRISVLLHSVGMVGMSWCASMVMQFHFGISQILVCATPDSTPPKLPVMVVGTSVKECAEKHG